MNVVAVIGLASGLMLCMFPAIVETVQQTEMRFIINNLKDLNNENDIFTFYILFLRVKLW
jgi:hypothetical protein